MKKTTKKNDSVSVLHELAVLTNTYAVLKQNQCNLDVTQKVEQLINDTLTRVQ